MRAPADARNDGVATYNTVENASGADIYTPRCHCDRPLEHEQLGNDRDTCRVTPDEVRSTQVEPIAAHDQLVESTEVSEVGQAGVGIPIQGHADRSKRPALLSCLSLEIHLSLFQRLVQTGGTIADAGGGTDVYSQ
jgi:hypothetical protein